MADEYTPLPSGLPEDLEPVLATDDTLVNIYGDTVFNVGDPEVDSGDTAPVTSGLGFGPVLQTALTSGLYNGDFTIGPPNPNEVISDANPLPYWRWVPAQGKAITAKWVADSEGPSGYGIQFTATYPGAVFQDYGYFEQIIPVSGVEQARAIQIRTGSPTSGSDTELAWYRSLQTLTADGSTAAVAYEDYGWGLETNWANIPGVNQVWCGIPNNARYIRVRVGVRVIKSATPTQTNQGTLLSVYAGPAFFESATVYASEETTLPATGTVALYAGAVVHGRWVVPHSGWISSVCARVKTARTSGQYLFAPYDATQADYVTSGVTIGASNPQYNSNIFGPNNVVNWVYRGDIVYGLGEVTSGTWAPTNNGVTLIYTVTMLPYAT